MNVLEAKKTKNNKECDERIDKKNQRYFENKNPYVRSDQRCI